MSIEDDLNEIAPVLFLYYPESDSFPLAGGKWMTFGHPPVGSHPVERDETINDLYWAWWRKWAEDPEEGLPVCAVLGRKSVENSLIVYQVAYPSTELWHGNEPQLPNIPGLLAAVNADTIAGIEMVDVICLKTTVGIRFPQKQTRPRSRRV